MPSSSPMKICVVLLGKRERDAAGFVTGSLTGIFTRPILTAKSKGDARAAGVADERRLMYVADYCFRAPGMLCNTQVVDQTWFVLMANRRPSGCMLILVMFPD